ncbi:MAG: adenylate/guanylate cyclase domain-containing protein [Verrucomicrobia bacterium]|nr:adenylate/guanylate cyclase domain-containing protein [Verrucomicrobiota bacterium]
MRRQKRSSPAIFLICAAIALLAAIANQMGWFDHLETKTIDELFRRRHRLNTWLKRVHVSGNVALVAVDQKSVEPSMSKSKHADRWGSGGWVTRDHWRNAIYFLVNHEKPSVVAYDILFLPYRTQSGSKGNSAGSEGGLIDQFLKGKKMPFREMVLEEDFPRLDLLNALDYACNTAFASRFYDVEDARSEGKIMPHFIMAYDFTRKEVEGGTVWNVGQEGVEDRVKCLKRQAIPAAWIHNVPPDYPYADNATLPFEELATAPVHLGFINVPRDPDGNIRRVPLVLGFRDPTHHDGPVFVPSIALRACLLHMGISLESKATQGIPSAASGMRVEFGREIRLWNREREIHIPVDRHGNLFLNFEGTIADFPRVPYIDILRYGEVLDAEAVGKLPDTPEMKAHLELAHEVKRRLENKIALIGLTFTAGGDIGPCAIDSNVPYVFIHVAAIDNILRASFMRPMEAAPVIVLLAGLLGFMGIANAFPQAHLSAVGTAGVLAGFPLAAMVLFYFNITCVPIVLPELSALVAFGAISLYRYQVEQKGRIEIRKKFSAMVSGRVLQYMEDHPERLSGERREATMFFSDVAGFTSISEKLSPEQLSQILNDYLTPMTDLILSRDGYVNKYAGDGIMAIWGVTYPQPDHAVQTCLSALEQQEKIRELKPVFVEKYNVPLKVRMGLNSGIVSAGNMGSRNRYEYTVMGDPVNFAARLEPANKDYGTLIMIGEQTYALAKEQIVGRLLDRIVVYGKTEPVAVYELVGRKGEVPDPLLETIAHFEKGLRLHWERDWKGALAAFEAALRLLPADPPSHTFIKRVKEYETQPPTPEWKGEYVRHGKS